MNFRMTELSGAVLLGQLRKLDQITSHLRANKAIVKDMLEEVPEIDFRTLTDPAGDLATHLVVVLPIGRDRRRTSPSEVGSMTLSESGWHVYSKMNHLLERRTVTGKGCPFDCDAPATRHGEYRAGMLPQTDALLERSISIGIGVRDANLAPFGLRMRRRRGRGAAVGATFRDAVIKHLA